MQESLEKEYRRSGYLDELTGELDYSRIHPDEHDEPDRMAELARDFAPSYADWRMRDMYLKVSSKRKKEGTRSKWVGAAVFSVATLLLILSLSLS